jgi:succinate-semialdehyde dehydrogenase / glutarate-semialdehyde dehydrogenase
MARFIKTRFPSEPACARTRTLVQDGVDDAFTKRLAETAGAMKVADGFEPGAVIGPLIDKKAVEKVEARIADAVKKGAKVVTGGPVPPLYRFKTEAEAIKMANDTEFGLASYFYSRDTGRIWRVAGPSNTASSASTRASSRRNPAGEIAPFGGMRKAASAPSGSPLGLEIRHRGIPRNQTPLHGRHRPIA